MLCSVPSASSLPVSRSKPRRLYLNGKTGLNMPPPGPAPQLRDSPAFDRLARARRPSEPCRAEALDAIRPAQLRLLRVETVWGNQTVQLHDIVSGEPLLVLDES